MTHYKEDDLILYYYGEGRKRPDIERHLDECGACAATYREIAGTLSMVTEPALPERGDQYGLEVWQRIRHKLPEQEVPWWMVWFRGERLMLVAAAAVLVLAAFVAGRYLPRQQSATDTAGSTQADATPRAPTSGAGNAGNNVQRQRILISSVADHLDRSERVLTDIMNTADRHDISTEQRWAEDLLTTSRLYRQDAIEGGEQTVACVLDEVGRSLIELVHRPARVRGAGLERLLPRIAPPAPLFQRP